MVQSSGEVFFPPNKNAYQPAVSPITNLAIKSGGVKNNCVSNIGNIINTQDLSYQACTNKTNTKYGNSGGYFKSSLSNSRQQKGQNAMDSNARHKSSNGKQSTYQLQKTNHSDSGPGSKKISNISNTSSRAPVHPGLGHEFAHPKLLLLHTRQQ